MRLMTGGNLRLSVPLRRFLQVLLLLWLVLLAVIGIERGLLHWSPDYWYPLFRSDARFTDLTIYQERFRHFHQFDFFTLAGFPFTYPAPVALVYEGFYLLGSYSLDAYFCFSILAFGIAGVLLGRAMWRRGLVAWQAGLFVGLSFLLSYPLWFMIYRANLEVVNWVLVAAGVAAYWNKKWYLAATFLGVAISFKIFPFVFLGLLWSSRKYLAALWGVAVAAVATVLSTWILGPTYHAASAGISQGLEYFRVHYALEIHRFEIGFDHSIFAMIKEVKFHHGIVQEVYFLPWLNGYMAVAALAGVVLFFWKIRKMPRANQILALTVASVLLPPVSSDYTLVHLYIPWAVLVLLSIRGDMKPKMPGLTASFVCLAFLMAPESYIEVYGVRFAGQVKGFCLCILFLISITHPFEEPISGANQDPFLVPPSPAPLPELG
jgi:glycosyl transferase family 87